MQLKGGLSTENNLDIDIGFPFCPSDLYHLYQTQYMQPTTTAIYCITWTTNKIFYGLMNFHVQPRFPAKMFDQ